ncbi:MAG: hypothetical protein ACKO6F_00460 [Cyanobium sp.]
MTALLATASGLQGPWAWMARLIQALLTASLLAVALAWMSRVTARRRQRAGGTPQRRLLAYPLWMAGLGLGCILLFSLFAWFAWHAPPTRGGPRAALVFVIFVLLGVVLVVSALADTYVLDEAGVERLRFGRSRRIAWSDVSRVGLPGGGQGIRLQSSDGRSLELAELLDGFGVLCDALLLRVPAGLRVDPEASLLVLRASSLEPEALQLSYARWFEGEEAAPPRGWIQPSACSPWAAPSARACSGITAPFCRSRPAGRWTAGPGSAMASPAAMIPATRAFGWKAARW